ncbi:MAG: polymer-forming cytoskeletal protein [Deltaproteobacteria bacterium]|nr:polymer-forming cytoskeletal protein [Deltaproteobacteria bacterium]
MIKTKKPDTISMLLGPGTIIEGTVEFENTVRLEGNVIGKIYSTDGTLIVGETAVVNGEIMVNVAIIMGRVNGKVNAGKRIEVYPPGRIEGDIQSPAVLIKSGVIFNGTCSMKV